MSRRLGYVQERVLKALVDHGRWQPGCGWVWGSPKRTQAVLDSLVRRELVNVVDGVYTPRLQPDACPWCVRGNLDEWSECERCGYTGNCAICGETVDPDSLYVTACSPECRAIQFDEAKADRKP